MGNRSSLEGQWRHGLINNVEVLDGYSIRVLYCSVARSWYQRRLALLIYGQ